MTKAWGVVPEVANGEPESAARAPLELTGIPRDRIRPTIRHINVASTDIHRNCGWTCANRERRTGCRHQCSCLRVDGECRDVIAAGVCSEKKLLVEVGQHR